MSSAFKCNNERFWAVFLADCKVSKKGMNDKLLKPFLCAVVLTETDLSRGSSLALGFIRKNFVKTENLLICLSTKERWKKMLHRKIISAGISFLLWTTLSVRKESVPKRWQEGWTHCSGAISSFCLLLASEYWFHCFASDGFGLVETLTRASLELNCYKCHSVISHWLHHLLHRINLFSLNWH